MAPNVRNIFGLVKAPFSDDLGNLSAHTSEMPKKRTPLSEAVGRRLRVLRLAKGFKKKRWFAEEVGWNEDRYDKWETGAALIPPEEALKLREKYGITSDWLYYGEEVTLTGTLQAELRKAS